MSHYYTSCANLTIGLLHSTAPDLVHDFDSEGGTPLVTPIHTTFGNISNYSVNTSGFDRLAYGECNHLGKHPLQERSQNCPPAPRIDNGSFESSLACEHESSFEMGISVGSSVYDSKDNYSLGSNQISTHPQHSRGTEHAKYSQVGVRREKAVLAYEDTSTLEDRYGIWTILRAPRPDTGSWSSSTGNIAPIVHLDWSSEKKPAFHCRSQLGGVASSASVKTLDKHLVSNSKTSYTKQLAVEEELTQIVKWNLGLGLTLDDIAEPDGCGASVGELSMEFAEDSFFDLEMDSGYCSTADTTLNTTMGAISDPAKPNPNSPVGSATQAAGPESGITPQLRMLSLQGHHKNVKRQRTQNSTVPRPGTRLAYAPGSPSETDVACLQGRARVDKHRGFCGLSNGAKFTQEFMPGEYTLSEAQGRTEHQAADTPISALLPPIEL